MGSPTNCPVETMTANMANRKTVHTWLSRSIQSSLEAPWSFFSDGTPPITDPIDLPTKQHLRCKIQDPKSKIVWFSFNRETCLWLSKKIFWLHTVIHIHILTHIHSHTYTDAQTHIVTHQYKHTPTSTPTHTHPHPPTHTHSHTPRHTLSTIHPYSPKLHRHIVLWPPHFQAYFYFIFVFTDW